MLGKLIIFKVLYICVDYKKEDFVDWFNKYKKKTTFEHGF